MWVTLALLFGVFLYYFAEHKFSLPESLPLLVQAGNVTPDALALQVFLEYLAGFVLEKALALDNVFVFLMIFDYFQVPSKYQHRVLYYGILGAIVFRAILISIGSAVMHLHFVVIIFGIFLMYAGVKFITSKEGTFKPQESLLFKFIERLIPVSTDFGNGEFVRRENGKLVATTLLLALILVEISDIIFAFDSVPAVFAVTNEPLIVFTSNIFAILGLRAMYFMLASVADKFHLLKYGLGLVLIFVGIKVALLDTWFKEGVPVSFSLSVIVTLIGGSIILSLMHAERHS